MNDFGSQYPQQNASAGPAGRQAGPPPRPPMQGMAAHPAPRPQQYPAPRPQGPQGPMQQGPGPFPGQQFPAQQAPRQPIPAQRRPERPMQQAPAQPQPAPAAWPSAQSSGPAWPAPAPAAPVEDPNAVPVRKKGKAGKVIGLLIVAAALGGVGWVVATGQQAPVTAAVGQCVTQTGTDDIAIVGCGEPSAQFKVAGKLENKTVIDASLFACSDFPDATSSYWQGVDGKPGTVLCLAPTKPAAPAAPAAPANP